MMGAYSIANTEFLSHDYDARGLDPRYRAVTKGKGLSYEWSRDFYYMKSVAEDIGGVVQKRFITEPKTITTNPDDKYRFSAQMVLVEAMLAALPLFDWHGDRDYLMIGDRVSCQKDYNAIGVASGFKAEVTWIDLDGDVLAPVFYQREYDQYHSPHQLLIEGWEFTLLAEADNA